MELKPWKTTAGVNESYKLIRELGLEQYVAELDTFGFTIVPPEKAAPPGFTDKLCEAVWKHSKAADKNVATLNVVDKSQRSVDGEHLFHTVKRDPIFREATVSPVAYALASYVVGASMRIYSSGSILKSGQINPVFLHCDSVSVPPPLPPWGMFCNATWILSEYSMETGPLFMVPGSHKLCRHPTAAEQPKCIGGPGDDDIVQPVLAKPGSLCVFHGITWHGAIGKDNSHTRVTYVTLYCRSFVMPAEDFSDITPEMMEQHGEKFAKLVWRDKWQGYREEGPSPAKLALTRPSTENQYG